MALCQHGSTLQNPISLLPMEVKGQEFLAVACYECRNIKIVERKGLLNFIWPRQARVVYKGVVHKMCPGEPNKIFVKTDGDTVLELDTSGQVTDDRWEGFSKVRKIKIGFDIVLGMCYLTSPESLLVLSSPVRIWAVSCDTNKIKWQIEGVMFGKKICPHSLLLLSESNLVLVADGNSSRILVLDPKDGSCLRALGLAGMGYMAQLSFHGNHIVILHYAINRAKYNISYLCLNKAGLLS